MKKININFTSMALGAAFLAFLAVPANAQHRESGGGGSAPARSAPSGGSAPQARPSYGGGNNFSRPSYNGGARVGVAQRPNVSQQGNTQRPVAAPRQGINPGQRGVSASVQIGLSAGPRAGAYRGAAGVGAGGVTRISGARAGGYYNAHGYYNSFYAPHLGFRLNVLPYGYYPFYFGPNQFFYSDGLYYQYADSQYTVVEPPVGAAISTLPDNAQSIVINGIQYYELNGVYYQPITKDDGSVVYQVAGKDGEVTTDTGANATQAPPQIGDLFQALPEGCKTVKLNGQTYYVSPDDYYFQDARDNNNNKVYKIVGTPTDEPNQ